MDHFDPALISVVMPCHNAAPFVEEAVASVLGQSYPQVELVVVDDGSTDGSTEILQRLASEHPERITLILQNRDGPFAARNHALAHANGNYIAFLDADDTWQPDALARMHDALETQPADIAYCGWQAIGNAAIDTQPNIPPELDAGKAILHFLQQSPWPINSVLIRRPLIDELRGFSERAPTAMDLDLWLRMLARQPRLVRVPDVLAFQRQHLRRNSHIPQWRQVFDAVAVRRDFARHHPESSPASPPPASTNCSTPPCCAKPIVATGATTPNPPAACSAAPSARPTGKPATSSTSSPACCPPRSTATWSTLSLAGAVHASKGKSSKQSISQLGAPHSIKAGSIEEAAFMHFMP
jgi:GT2 family glycosyltransferase